MELYNATTDAEQVLCAKADLTYTPIGGTIELLPLCNMKCKMCYVHQSKEEMNKHGRMLNADEWIKIVEQGIDEGLLFLLFTGGEPLLYPEFKRLYAELSQKGLVLSVNTNGTLIDEAWAEFFHTYGCRRLNITLYGKDDETYEKLCQNPKGFTQVMNAVEWLKKKKVPFRLTCSVTPYNVEQLPELFRIAADLQVPMATATYMFPAARRGINACEQVRLSPSEAAKATILCYQLKNPKANMKIASQNTLARMKMPPKLRDIKGFNCRAGHSGFWMNWKGEMLPCGMFKEPAISLLDHSFKECWDYIVAKTQEIKFCEKCVNCDKQNICQICPAHCYTETGDISGCPDYVCEMTEKTMELMNEYLV